MKPVLAFFNAPNISGGGTTRRMAYYQWGAPENQRAAVCVHGLTRNARDFDFLAQSLAADYRVICIDMPGRGKSDWLEDPAGYAYPSYLPCLIALLEHLGISRCDWIGTSMGGILGMMLCNARPTLIGKLVLNDIGPFIPASAVRRIRSYAGIAVHFSNRAEAEKALRETYFAPYGITREEDWRFMFEISLVARQDGGFRLAYDPAIATALGSGAVEDVDLWAMWPAVQCATLLIRGAESDVLTHETALEMQARHAGLELMTIANAGHAPALLGDAILLPIRRWLLK